MSDSIATPPDTPRLVRNSSGSMAHYRDCYVVGRSKHMIPWHWADEHTAQEVSRQMAAFRIKACLICMPLGRLLFEERNGGQN